MKLSLLPLCGFRTIRGVLLALAGALAGEHAQACMGSQAALPPQEAAEETGVHTKASLALRASCEASASYASPAQKLQVDLEGELGDLVPPACSLMSEAKHAHPSSSDTGS